MMHVAIALLLLLQTPDEKAKRKEKDDEAKKKVDEFHKKLEKAKPAEIPDMLVDLGQLKHERVLDELAKWLGKPDKDCQKTAARELAGYRKEKELAPKAGEALLKTLRNARELEMIEAFLGEIGALRWRGAVKTLIPLFGHAKLDVQKAAIDACGRIGSRDAIAPLLDLVRELEAIPDDEKEKPPDLPGPKPPPTPDSENEKRRRKKEILPPAVGALTDITGEKHKTGKEWAAWWSKNAKTWKELEDK